jgi:hypothetical protein
MTIRYYESVFHALYDQNTADNIIKKIDCEIKQMNDNQEINLYRITDENFEVYVLAETIELALNKWREWLAKKYDSRPDQVSEPNCIVFTAYNDQILL